MTEVHIHDVEKPIPSGDGSLWGSDVLARMLRILGVEYVALNPGASFRGLHDSMVNHLGNRDPQMLLCLHEEHAASIAHGYAKVSGRPMGVIMHSNVGLMHGCMAIFNAWCDRVPMLVFGATGPVDAAHRRPWIDWIHTSRDQGALVRHYVKWDDQPASVEAAIEAMLRANMITKTAPCGPTYVNFDASIQERRLDAMPELPAIDRYGPPEVVAPSAAAVDKAVKMIREADRPLVLAGRTSRDPTDWARRVALVEALGANVITDIKVGAAFPTDHQLHPAKPSFFLDDTARKLIEEADLVLSLDWLDLAGTMKQAPGSNAKLIQISLDHQLHNGWGMEYQAVPAVDLHLACEPDIGVHAIADALSVGQGTVPTDTPVRPAVGRAPADADLDITTLAAALGEGLAGQCACLVRLPLGWAGETWHFGHPLDFLGYDGGGGIGSGPGMVVGAALALRDTGRLPVAVLGDGDFMMASSAFWTAARYRIPLLVVVANNRSFYNDEVHQERVALARQRPVENKWIGQKIEGPDIDLAAIARAQGLASFGPVETAGDLVAALHQGLELVRQGEPVIIDARVKPGYNPAMVAGLTRSG